MRKGLFLLLLLPMMVFASGGDSMPLTHLKIDLKDKAALQRGAKMYMNYCAGCHSMKYMRYNRMAKDIGLVKNGAVDEKLLEDNLIFTGAKPGSTINIAMPKKDAQDWFGVAAPDLTLAARIRGVDWLYTYLTNFYDDPSRPWGTNNRLYPDVAMPNVLAALQGEQLPVYRTQEVPFGNQMKKIKVIDHLQLLKEGSMTEHQFDAAIRDLVTFLAYAAEPMQLTRVRIGIWVTLFLLVLCVLTYLLKKEFWKDIH